MVIESPHCPAMKGRKGSLSDLEVSGHLTMSVR
jgi:hypothetical protein